MAKTMHVARVAMTVQIGERVRQIENGDVVDLDQVFGSVRLGDVVCADHFDAQEPEVPTKPATPAASAKKLTTE